MSLEKIVYQVVQLKHDRLRHMIFHAFSLCAQTSLDKFEAYQKHNPDRQNHLFSEKVKRCGYKILLVASDEPDLSEGQSEGVDKQILLALSAAWRSICEVKGSQKAYLEKSWQIIDRIGESIPFRLPSTSLYVRRFCQFKDEDFLFILLTGDETVGLPTDEILLLCNLWQFKQGFFPMHASGIQHKGHLYLFIGPSGAGKSTVAALSSELGDQVIDDDQVLVHARAGGYSADGWGYGFVPCEAPLRAIFRLVQDAEERLIPLNQLQVTRLILERHSDILGRSLTSDLLRQSFHQASEMARQVPGFELHFRKSPDFWKLIDAQFPD